MSSPIATEPLSEREGVREEVPCPFCGLACDDLALEAGAAGIAVIANGCERSRRMFGAHRAQVAAPARIAGEAATLDAAVARAAELLRGAAQPAFGGLATDVAGMRAVLELAERLGGVVDHLGSRALFRNVLALQDRGWMTTTLAEVRNRADFIVVAGTDVVSRFPRFFERVAFGDAMFVRDAEREVVFIGAHAAEGAVVAAGGRAASHVHCDNEGLGEVFAALRALVAGTMPEQAQVRGVPMSTLRQLAQRMCGARYGVLVWAAADLDFAHAELAIGAMCACVIAVNEHTRFASLPLAGTDGDQTVNQVCLWQTGFPLRLAFAGGTLDYDPHRYGLDALLARGDVDALVWVSSFDARRTPPPADCPAIVLARPGMRVEPAPAVQIDVGTPGLTHAGHVYRGDGVVAVRLRRIVDSPLPTVADVVGQIAAAL